MTLFDSLYLKQYDRYGREREILPQGELLQGNLFQKEALNGSSLCRSGFHENNTFTFLTYKFHA